MEYQFDFNIEKGIESILYILKLLENKAQPTLHRVSKVLYFADKEHLEKYGRFIFGDRIKRRKVRYENNILPHYSVVL
ncbi:hypothetical protein PL8927_70018 [Planktothrix serta PCC 8927]|uniref:Uncharacterized protein n=1 Tax=Planktothrix serta PCC 8927 TaxID=671068 RepID=A0A7Z9BW65_9CYAN|nr:hypothetical protein [Planktothrix serta]VXD20803.1 hypothetical protein PL8927_70018 [Planktothrix serta PCC 8927]